MSNLTERHEKERQLETDVRILQLRVKRLEHLMAYELDPFGPEFDEAAEKLRKLKAALYSACVERDRYHRETFDLERKAEAERQAEKDAKKKAAYLAAHPQQSPEFCDRLYKNQPEI